MSMDASRHNTPEPWARAEHPRSPPVERRWRFVVLIGSLAIGVSDAGIVIARLDNDLVADLTGRDAPRAVAARRWHARRKLGRRLIDELAASWGINR